MHLSRMYVREILANVDRDRIEPEVLAALEAAAAGRAPTIADPSAAVTSADLQQHATALKNGGDAPEYVPLTYTDEQLAKIIIDDNGRARPATQADVVQINAMKKAAHDAEWRMARGYRPNLNPKDAINAAFAPPDLPPGYGVENLAVGGVNRAGDRCVTRNAAGESVYTCANGHGYVQSPSVPGCPRCFAAGGGSSSPDRTDDDDRPTPGEDYW